VLSGNEATTVDGASTWTGTVIICAAGIPRANGATTVDKASTSSGTVAVAGVYTSVGIDAAITDAGVLSINGAATVDGASTNVSIACEDCEADKTWEDDGTCVACGTSNQVMVWLFSIALFIVICLVYVVSATKDTIQPMSHTILFVALLGTQVITVLQQSSIIGAIAVTWAEPMRSFFKALDVVELDMDIMHPDCVKRLKPLEKIRSEPWLCPRYPRTARSHVSC